MQSERFEDDEESESNRMDVEEDGSALGFTRSSISTYRTNSNAHELILPRQSISTSPSNENLTQTYIRQLLYGCGKPLCSNPFCASNPAYSASGTQEVATLAATLARVGTQHLCSGLGNETSLLDSLPDQSTAMAESFREPQQQQLPLDPLTFELISAMVKESKEKQDWSHLMRTLFYHFTSLQNLTKCFLKDGKLNNSEIKAGFHLLSQHCPPTVTNCVMTSISMLLDKIKLNQETLTELNLSAFIIILDFPSMLDASFHHSVVGGICELFSNLSPNLRQKLISLWCECKIPQLPSAQQKKESGNDLMGVIAIFQHFITMRIYSLTSQLGFSVAPNKDEPVAAATKALAIFYEINEIYQLISFEEFYNEAVNENLEIKDDFPHWKAKEGFSFCNFPFILNPATKSDILKVESMIQMRHELQDSFFRAMFIGVNSPYLVLDIRRDHIIRDSLYQLETKKPQDLKKQLKIQFVGEEAVDEGGVQKEFFQLVVREIFDPKYDIFKQNETSQLFWFCPNFIDDSLADPQLLEELKLVGKLIGLAIYNSVIMDIHFPTCLYKKLCDVAVGLEDLKVLDPLLAKSLETLMEFDGDVESTFDRTFQIDLEVFGEMKTFELKPGGSTIVLNNDNRKEFVDLYVDFMLNKMVERPFRAFREGFDSVCSGSAIQLFRPEEIELLVCGSSDLDFEALELVTTYDGGFSKESPVIQFFWEIVHEYTEEQKKRLLFFTTGTDRVPIGGLSKLNFVIAKNGPDSDRLPSSHTCFNVLLLPEYTEKEKLKERLMTALQNAEGFGMI